MADMIRRTLPYEDWKRIKRALLLHASECNTFADELNRRYGHPCPAADQMREEAASTSDLLKDLDIPA